MSTFPYGFSKSFNFFDWTESLWIEVTVELDSWLASNLEEHSKPATRADGQKTLRIHANELPGAMVNQIGQVVLNLRSVMTFIAWDIYFGNRGNEEDENFRDVAWPLVATPEEFAEQCKSCFPQFPARLIEIIRQMQDFNQPKLPNNAMVKLDRFAGSEKYDSFRLVPASESSELLGTNASNRKSQYSFHSFAISNGEDDFELSEVPGILRRIELAIENIIDETFQGPR